MSKLTLCNEALGHLAMQAITQTQLDDNEHPSAVACNLYFDSARRDVLREHQFAFADTQEELEELDEEEILGWLFVYSYPTAAVNVWKVYNEGSLDTKDKQDFEIKYLPSLAVNVICSDIDEALADYSYDIEDTDLWDSQFKEAFTYKLAAKMSHTLIGDPSIGTAMMNVYLSKISETKRVGASEQIKQPPQSSGYKNAR